MDLLVIWIIVLVLFAIFAIPFVHKKTYGKPQSSCFKNTHESLISPISENPDHRISGILRILIHLYKPVICSLT